MEGNEAVLAMAGHVDHGKSALAAALTGQQGTDRRVEERTRGLTTDLGHLFLRDGTATVALTDVPGHVDYLANTIVGLAGATAALLVVAADDGWMPQTEDHVRAACALAVPVVVTAVTKVDRVDDARRRAVVAGVRQRLAAHGVDCPIVATSTVTGSGIAELRGLLAGLAPTTPPDPGLPPSLWVDRAFRLPGRGLVVAGTLHRGRLHRGDTVAVAPRGDRGRARGLQRHGSDVATVSAPTRVAIDLAGGDASRGDRLVDGRLADDPPATTRADAWITSLGEEVTRRGAWLVHVGSTQVEARLRPLGGAISANDAGPVSLELARPLPLVLGDRFVLHEAGRRVVAGGGVVLDPAPPGRPRGASGRRDRATALAALAADPTGHGLAASDGGLSPATRVARALGDPDLPGCRIVADHVVAPAWAAHLADRAAELVARAGADGLATSEAVTQLAERLSAPATVVRELLAGASGLHDVDGRLVHEAHVDAHAGARRDAAAALRRRLEEDLFAPPRLAEAAAGAGVGPAQLDALVARGEVLVSGEYGFVPQAVPAVVARLRALEARHGPFTVARVRDALGVSRRHAVPWVELLDREGLTERSGDLRRLTDAAG